MITAEELRRRFDYNPETGIFTWKELHKSAVNTHIGGVAGSKDSYGYWRLPLHRGRMALAHRLAWLYVYGVWPSKQLDHINRCKSDNRIANLREVSNRENCLNTDAGKSGLRGASWEARSQKWRAQIWIKGVRKTLGFYVDPIDAHLHYQWARISYDREFF